MLLSFHVQVFDDLHACDDLFQALGQIGAHADMGSTTARASKGLDAAV